MRYPGGLGGSNATWQGEGVEKAWQDAQDWFGHILLGGCKKEWCCVLIHPTCLGYPVMIIRIEDGQKPTVKFFLASVLQKYGGVPEGFGSKSLLLFFYYGCLADWLQCVN
jgi:hypothetical protein